MFLELNDDTFRVFSWEGNVQVRTKDGEEFTLQSGQQLLLDLKRQLDDTRGRVTDAIEWEPPAPMADTDIDRRMKGSALINGFSTPLDTLPIIERELGTSAAPRD